jgi:hypothetical protein
LTSDITILETDTCKKKKRHVPTFTKGGETYKKKEEKQSIYKEKENRALERETGVKYSEKKKESLYSSQKHQIRALETTGYRSTAKTKKKNSSSTAAKVIGKNIYL